MRDKEVFKLSNYCFLSDSTKVESTEDNSLFWAMRGGGAGPWGAVTAMTIRLHKPRNNCQQSCYQVTNAG